MASEGEKSVISIVNHNESHERPGNFLTKNWTDASNLSQIMNIAPIYQLCKQKHREGNWVAHSHARRVKYGCSFLGEGWRQQTRKWGTWR